MTAENMTDPTPDGTARTMIELLQEINKNLIENLKQQNERIAEIETKLAGASFSDVQKSTPILPEMAVEEVVRDKHRTMMRTTLIMELRVIHQVLRVS
jgi:hypothetical protein